MQRTLGPAVMVKTVEEVPAGPRFEEVIDKLVQDGNRLIFTVSFDYMDGTLRSAARYRDVFFCNSAGFKSAKNMLSYAARYYEPRYLTGLLAGKMSRNPVIGYVAAYPIPEVLRGLNAFTLGVRAVNPKAQVLVRWVNSWFAPETERRLARELVNNGASLLTHHTDSSITVQVAEDNNCHSIGYHSDMSPIAPNGHLCAITHHWGDYYTKAVRSVIDGTWRSDRVWGGIGDGFVDLSPFNKSIPESVIQLVASQREKIAMNQFKPFSGELIDNTGKVRLNQGSMSDDALMRMNYLIAGVSGSLTR